MNCKPVSVISEPLSFLLQPKLIWLAVLSINYWSFDFNASRFRKKFKIIFKFFVPFEISHFLNIDSSHWLREDVQWIIVKVFRERTYFLIGLDTFSHFSTQFLVLPIFIVVFIVIRLTVMFY